jgi:hypothetical protein
MVRIIILAFCFTENSKVSLGQLTDETIKRHSQLIGIEEDFLEFYSENIHTTRKLEKLENMLLLICSTCVKSFWKKKYLQNNWEEDAMGLTLLHIQHHA